jgi:hypothetical protein
MVHSGGGVVMLFPFVASIGGDRPRRRGIRDARAGNLGGRAETCSQFTVL